MLAAGQEAYAAGTWDLAAEHIRAAEAIPLPGGEGATVQAQLAALAASGHVRVNGQRIDAPSRAVKVDDVVTVALDRIVRIMKVVGFAERRGSADDARDLFVDLTRGDDAQSAG